MTAQKTENRFIGLWKTIWGAIGRVISFLDRMVLKAEEWILSFAVLAMAGIILYNVFSRKITGSGSPIIGEVTDFLIIMVTFMGISYAARKGRHIRMSALFDALPHKLQKGMAIFIPTFTAIILFALCYYSVVYVVNEYNRGVMLTALQMPAYLLYLFIPVGFFLGALQYIRNIWINIVEKEVYVGTERKTHSSVDEKEPSAV